MNNRFANEAELLLKVQNCENLTSKERKIILENQWCNYVVWKYKSVAFTVWGLCFPSQYGVNKRFLIVFEIPRNFSDDVWFLIAMLAKWYFNDTIAVISAQLFDFEDVTEKLLPFLYVFVECIL